jgi:hypothetical protein
MQDLGFSINQLFNFIALVTIDWEELNFYTNSKITEKKLTSGSEAYVKFFDNVMDYLEFTVAYMRKGLEKEKDLFLKNLNNDSVAEPPESLKLALAYGGVSFEKIEIGENSIKI